MDFTRSVFAQVFLSPLVYAAWRAYRGADIADLPVAELVPLGLALCTYIALPIVTGFATGSRQRRRGTGIPSAWDALFDQPGLRGYVRARLRSGEWVGGVYLRPTSGRSAHHGFASGYPDPETLYLPTQLVLNAQTGEIAMGPDGPLMRQWGVLLRGHDIELIEFQPFDDGEI